MRCATVGGSCRSWSRRTAIGYKQRGIQPHYVFVRPDGSALEVLGAMVDEERLRVHLERAWPLEQAAAAMERLEETAAPPASWS